MRLNTSIYVNSVNDFWSIYFINWEDFFINNKVKQVNLRYKKIGQYIKSEA